MCMGYTVLKITEDSRAALLSGFAPKFANVVCHHITLAFHVPEDTPLPAPQSVRVVGYACDETGVEALVVEVDGKTERDGGRMFHITLSLADGRKPVESNDLLREKGFVVLSESIDIEAPAAFIPFDRG
jgi:hypothetical protein